MKDCLGYSQELFNVIEKDLYYFFDFFQFFRPFILNLCLNFHTVQQIPLLFADGFKDVIFASGLLDAPIGIEIHVAGRLHQSKS